MKQASTRNIRVRLLLPLGQVGGNRLEPGAGPRASWAQVKDPGLQEQRAAESHSGKEAKQHEGMGSYLPACSVLTPSCSGIGPSLDSPSQEGKTLGPEWRPS